MLAEVGIARDSVVVDLEGEYATAFEIALRPAAVVVRDGIVSEGAVVRNPRQLHQLLANTGVVDRRGGARQLRRFHADLVEVSVTLYERFEKLSEVDNAVTTRGRFLGRAAKACLGGRDRRSRAFEGRDGQGRRRLLCARLPEPMPELHGARVRLRQRLQSRWAWGTVSIPRITTGCALSATPAAGALGARAGR